MNRILWIDDEPSRFKILAKHLDIENWDIYFAHGFDQINHYLNNGFSWHCVLLDGDMNLMSGVDVARDFLCERSIPIIIVSMNPDKVAQIAAILDDYQTPHYIAPITNGAILATKIREI